VAARIRNLCAPIVQSPRDRRRRAVMLVTVVALAAAVVACALPFTHPAPVRLSPGITPPRVLHQVKPQYSPEAMQSKKEGEVLLDVVVARDGTVRDPRVVKSIPELDQAAIAAARQWVFEPGRRKGRPVDVLVTLQFTFTLK
jgi:protein TonB